MTKKPSYRFAGYTEPWEEKKLGEYAKYRRGSFPQPYGKKEWYGGEDSMPFVQVIDVTDNLTLVNDTKQKISKQAQPKSVLAPKGTVIVTLQGSIGRVAITHYDTYVDRTLLIFESYNFPTHVGFWAYTIQNKFEIERKKAPGGTIKTITKEALSSFEISLPSLPEQTTIGSFFQDIDQLISLQQRKLEVLKEQKKTYLKLLFPAKGQKKPALRFAGFEDEWKEVKLGEIGEIQTGNTPPTNEEDNYEKNGFPWVTPTDINSLVLHTTSKQLSEVGKSKARIAKSGSILVTCIASIGKNTLVRTDSAFNQQINSLTPSEKYSSYFLLTQSEIWSRYMLSVAGAGTMQIINKSDFSNIKTMVPSLPEQEAIGSFFQDLDKAIAKQEEKVNQLKESKQTLLRKMFI
ncbi:MULTISPECIES: restriction endonuclease subunit S [Streptococcus]|uniref:Type I restriction-modification system S protein n=1 Tax=Streptococcus infantis TaxID=68892 RepID=A0A0F3HH83_9STRE|nr:MULTISPECIES: restriction endonuclease subunit S [Streptococcus]KJU93475.1 type I restriction-modification system S protein [Streptococcus infantis]MDN5024464.1 restriction endonuclease subunit S [Streptococcus sp. SO4]